MLKWIKDYASLPQVWLFLIILAISIGLLILSSSLYTTNQQASAIYSDISIGCLTGLILSFLTGLRQIYIYYQQQMLAWLKLLKSAIDKYDSEKKNITNGLHSPYDNNTLHKLYENAQDISALLKVRSSSPRKPTKYCEKRLSFNASSFLQHLGSTLNDLQPSAYVDSDKNHEYKKIIYDQLTVLLVKANRDIEKRDKKIEMAQRSII